MPENAQIDSQINKEAEIDKCVDGKDSLLEVNPVGLPISLRGILLGGAVLLIVLLLISVFLPNLSERVKFFTVNALSLLVLLAIVVQTYIYRRQADTMEKQGSAMRGQLAAMEWQAGILEIQTSLVDKQVTAMQEQLEIMKRQLENSAVGERAYLIIEDVVFIEKGEHPRLMYTLFNGGRTPAFNVTSNNEASLGTKPLADRLHSLGHPHDDVVDMPAGTKKQVEGTFPNFTVTKAHWGQVNAGTLTLFVRGVFRYKDFQDIERRLPYCVGYDVGLNRFTHYKAKDYSEDKD